MKVAILVIAAIAGLALTAIPSGTSITIEGRQASSWFGYSTTTGDFNGDGITDIAVGAPHHDSGSTDRGAVFIFLCPLRSNLTTADANGTYYGESAGDLAGWALASGDVNGDGFDDIIVGSPENDGSYPNAGKVHLLFGRRSFHSGASISVANASYLGLDNGDRVGSSLATGDVNGDGFDDVVIGSPHVDTDTADTGAVYVVFGKASGWDTNVRLYRADASYEGVAAHDGLGFNVTCGDVNADGFSDILMSAPQKKVYQEGEGLVYVCYGRRGSWEYGLDASRLNVSFRGARVNASLGWSLSAGIDATGDGVGDILLGSPGEKGRVLLLPGGTTWGKRVNAPANAVLMVNGMANGDRCGMAAVLALIDRSLEAGMIIGAPGADARNGTLSLMPPGVGGNLSEGDVTNGTFNSSYGFAISAGDIDGDGLMDAVVSAPWANTSVFQGGMVRILEYTTNTAPEIDDIRFHTNGTQDPTFFLRLDGWITINASGTGGGPLRDIAWVRVNSSSLPRGIRIPLLETGPDTGVFSGRILIAGATDDDARVLGASWGDWVHVWSASAHRRAILNIPPTIPTNDTTVADEDVQYSTHYAHQDGNGDDVLWFVNISADWLQWDAVSHTLQGTPRNPDVGTVHVSIRIEDPHLGNCSREFNVTVRNAPPTITTADVMMAYEDSHYEVDYSCLDDGEGAVWSFSSNASWLAFDAAEAVLSGDPDNRDVGTYWVNVTVVDGNGGSDHHNFTLTVFNTPLTIITDDITTVYQDAIYYNDYNSTDDPDVTWSLHWTNASWLELNATTGELSGLPTNWDVGVFGVNVSASDQQGGIDYHNFTLNVINLPPVITLNDTLIATEDRAFRVEIVFTDNGTGTNLTVMTDALWLSEIGPTLGGTPTDDDVDTYFVDVTVTDMWGASDHVNVTLRVDNTPPGITGSPPYGVDEDEPYLYGLNATDPGVKWSVEGASWLAILPNGTLVGTPANADVGTYAVNITAIDRHGGTASLTFDLTVTNVPPEISATPVTTATEKAPYAMWLNATDAPVIWTLSTGADWLGLVAVDPPLSNGSTALLSGIPLNDDVGPWSVNVTVDDGHGGTDRLVLQIEVANVPPEIIGTIPDEVLEDATYRVDLNSTDDPGVTWSLVTFADWLTINGSGEILGVPRNEHVGVWQISVMVDDGHGGRAWLNRTVNVINTDPDILNDPMRYVRERDTYRVQMVSSDGGNISWLLDGPPWLTIVPDTGVVTGTPRNGDVGTCNVTVTLLDGNGGSAALTFDLQVYNEPPEILTAPDNDVVEGYEYVLRLESTDDGPGTTWTVRTNATWLSFNASGQVLYGIPGSGDLGPYRVNISVNDGFGGVAHLNFTVEVLNGPPSLTVPYIPPILEDTQLDVPVIHDEPIVEWSFSTDADWLVFNTTSERICGIPDNSDVGTWHVNVSGIDRGGLIGYLELMLVVDNRPPEITPYPPLNVTEDALYRVDLNSTDSPEHWNLTGPSWLTIDPDTGILWGTPGDVDSGAHDVLVTVSDGNGGVAELPFLLYVVNVNDRPVIRGEEITITNATEPYVVNLTGIDPDGDPLEWDLVTNATFLHLSSGGVLSGLPMNDDVGEYAVSISVTDPPGLTAWRNFTLIVLYKDRAPVLSGGYVWPPDGDDHTWLQFTVWYYDPEGAPPASIAVVVDGVRNPMYLDEGVASDGRYAFKIRLGRGTHTYYFEASDGRNEARSSAETPLRGSPASVGVKAHEDIGLLLLLDATLIALFVILLLLTLLYALAPQVLAKGLRRLDPRNLRRRSGVGSTPSRQPTSRTTGIGRKDNGRRMTGAGTLRHAPRTGPTRVRTHRPPRS